MIRRAAMLAPLVAGLAVAAAMAFGHTARGASAPERLAVHEAPREIGAIEFADANDQSVSLEDFAGKIVVLNVWATWCPPCREEMPTLDALQKELGGEDLEVIALSVDRNGPQVVRDFYREIGIEHLTIYIDESMESMADLRIRGVPTTLILDRRGRELARLTGEADWAAPQMLGYLRGLIEEGAR